jgi:hypothetical protein
VKAKKSDDLTENSGTHWLRQKEGAFEVMQQVLHLQLNKIWTLLNERAPFIKYGRGRYIGILKNTLIIGFS